MNSNDPAFWPLFFILGVPIILLWGGEFGWRALVLLGALAGLATHPLITGAALILYALRTPLRWAAEAFIFGLAGGVGARLSGVMKRADFEENRRRRILWITLDVAIAVLFLQWLGTVIDPGVYSFIVTVVIVLVVVHLTRRLLKKETDTTMARNSQARIYRVRHPSAAHTAATVMTRGA